jgi:hypothetical protein
MSEATSAVLACQECGNEIVAKATGAKPVYCAACVKERTRINNRDAARRRRAGIRLEPTARTCVDCQTPFTPRRLGGRPSLRCTDCQAEYTREGVRAWQRIKGHQPTGTILTCTCEVCAATFEWTVSPGRPAWMCEDCKRVSYLAAAPSRRRHGHVRRARLRGAGYEKFEDLEIFERDKWKCGICLKRINKTILWPNRMCVTLDHIIPVSEGGPHSRANTRAAHYSCNSSRSNRGGNEQLALLG